jgi:hypothetical protein
VPFLRHLLWIDCGAALIAAALVLSLSGWLSALYDIPRHLLVGIGVVNAAYGLYSFSLARRAHRPRALIALLVVANFTWAGCCALAAIRLAATASAFGLAHLIGEGVFVATLAALEWHRREQLRQAT